MTALEETVADYQTLGLTTGPHPMIFYREWVKKRGMKACGELTDCGNGQRLTVAGGVICRQRPETARGFMFMTMEDETGMANIIFRPQVFDGYRRVIMGADFLSVTGKLQLEDGVTNLIADSVDTLPLLPGDPHLPARNFH